MEARNYPVAPGNSVMFRDETGPYIYSKSMGYSQLDTPRFDKYRLVKEEDAPVSTPCFIPPFQGSLIKRSKDRPHSLNIKREGKPSQYTFFGIRCLG
jgi:hypothetical protein